MYSLVLGTKYQVHGERGINCVVYTLEGFIHELYRDIHEQHIKPITI